jgi:hypothetical protein
VAHEDDNRRRWLPRVITIRARSPSLRKASDGPAKTLIIDRIAA